MLISNCRVQLGMAFAINSGPLSLRDVSWHHEPRTTPPEHRLRPWLVIPRSTVSVRHSRVKSSMIEYYFLRALPLVVRSNAKSQHHTSFIRSERRRWHAFSDEPRRRFFRGFFGTFRPS